MSSLHSPSLSYSVSVAVGIALSAVSAMHLSGLLI